MYAKSFPGYRKSSSQLTPTSPEENQIYRSVKQHFEAKNIATMSPSDKAKNNRRYAAVFDIDDTLIFTNPKTRKMEKIALSLRLMKLCARYGFYIVLLTARTNTLDIRRYTEKQLRKIVGIDKRGGGGSNNNNKKRDDYECYYDLLIMMPQNYLQDMVFNNDNDYSRYKYEAKRDFVMKLCRKEIVFNAGDNWCDIFLNQTADTTASSISRQGRRFLELVFDAAGDKTKKKQQPQQEPITNMNQVLASDYFITYGTTLIGYFPENSVSPFFLKYYSP